MHVGMEALGPFLLSGFDDVFLGIKGRGIGWGERSLTMAE
jgi:hypothetical protein